MLFRKTFSSPGQLSLGSLKLERIGCQTPICARDPEGPAVLGSLGWGQPAVTFTASGGCSQALLASTLENLLRRSHLWNFQTAYNLCLMCELWFALFVSHPEMQALWKDRHICFNFWRKTVMDSQELRLKLAQLIRARLSSRPKKSLLQEVSQGYTSSAKASSLWKILPL